MSAGDSGLIRVMSDTDTPRRRRSGRSPADRGAGIGQLPWRQVTNRYRPSEVLDPEQVEAIHDASLDILEEIGIEFLSPGAAALMVGAGGNLDGDGVRLRLDRAMVLEAVAKAPSSFTLHARNPAHDLTVGDGRINFATVASAPNASDLDGGRRPGNFVDFQNLVRLGQSLNVVHMIGGYPVEPTELPAATRHLDCYLSMIGLTDKLWRPYALGGGRIEDAIEMTAIARGLDRDGLARSPSVLTNVNTNSPLRVDGPMLDGLTELARAGQAISVTPFTLAGAMSPITLAGSLAQQNAEALAVIAYAQIVRPGTPVIYGGFTSNVDMKSGAPAFGTPENARAVLAGGQLARRYNLPYRSSNANAANVPDAQAAWESMMSLWSAVMSHANLIMHGAGWLEGGLVASFEKMVIDAELLQAMAVFLEPIEVNRETLALDAIREVGPGGHFFGAAHTLARYETAFYAPLLADWRNYESWREAGGKTAYERANAIWKQMLTEYRPPPLDAAAQEALQAYVAKRKEAIGRTR
jgi:trimethylamine--corrinoid protein Co-methyltransferase